MKILLWNTETFERLNRSLIRWLNGDIVDGEKIRRIQMFVTVYNDNEESRIGDNVKTDRDVYIMMHNSEEIVLMVVIT